MEGDLNPTIGSGNAKGQGLQVWLLPWVGLRSRLTLGPVTIWPFASREAPKRIPDARTRQHLRRYLRRYVDLQGKPVKTVMICSHGASDCRQLSAQEARELRAVVDAVAFCSICRGMITAVNAKNNSMAPPTAEAFQLYCQNLVLGSDDLAMRVGSTLHGGLDMRKVIFLRPGNTGGMSVVPDERVIEAFGRLLSSGFDDSRRERIFRGLEWFRFAHVDSDSVSRLSRIVMMATAFEILLGAPVEGEKINWIANKVAAKCADSSSVQETRAHGKRSEPCTRPRVAWWAYDFYKLRNSIVHGDAVGAEALGYPQPDLPWMKHEIAADLLFWELVTRELFDQRWLGDDIRRDAEDLRRKCPGPVEPGLEDCLLTAHMRYDNIHRALGWRPKLDPL